MAEDANRVVAKELLERNDAELKSLLGSKEEELQQVVFSKALKQLQQPHRIKALKKDIARIKTVLSSRAGSQS